MVAVDELAPGFDVKWWKGTVSQRPDAPADTVASLEDGDLGAAPGQLASGHESRKPRADYHHAAAAQRRCFSRRRRAWGGHG